MINKKIFVILYISIFFASLSAQLRIEIKGGLQDPIVVAVVPMKWNLDSPQELFIHEVIKSDLESFGEFKVLPPNNMLSLPASKEQVFYKDWRLLGTDYLVIGNVQPTNTDKEIEVKYFIFDVTREKTIHSGVVLGPKKNFKKYRT
jgi:TolB protein